MKFRRPIDSSVPFKPISSTGSLSSKVLFIFPHGTCSLSVSRQYLALDEFTTHFERHSQTTRLFESASKSPVIHAKEGILTLYDASIPGDFVAWSSAEDASLNYNSGGRRPPDFKFERFPLHSQY